MERLPSEILDTARTLLVSEGWIQGRYQDDNGDRMCAYGAIMRASECGENELVNEWGKAADYLAQTISPSDGHSAITQFNDKEGRQLSEVLEKFDTAIALAKAEGE